MRVISIRRLREFWTKHPRSEQPLRIWYKIAEKASWNSIVDVRNVYPTVDALELDCEVLVAIFNIKENQVRLVVTIDYEFHHIYVKRVLTHREYDGPAWKARICQD